MRGEKGPELSVLKNFWLEPRYRSRRIALFFAALVALTDLGVRAWFSRPGIIDRNPGNTTASMPYLFSQMGKSTRPRIAFIGSSVTQGYGNTPDGKHFPALVGAELRSHGSPGAAVFNLSSAGNRFGDHFANLVEAARYHPDLAVCAIHIKMFSVNAGLADPLNHDESLYYFRGDPVFGRGGARDMTQRFRTSDRRYREIWLDFQAQKLSGLYRYRRLLSYFLIHDHQFPAAAAGERAKKALGLIDPILVESSDTNYDERNADYLWKVIPDHVIQLQYLQCEAFDFSDENLNFLTFRDMCAWARDHRLRMMFFLNPINKDFVEARRFFDWAEVVPLFRKRVAEVTQEYGHLLVDATTRIDPRYFSDLDHLNMNGHKQMAAVLMPYIGVALRH